MLRFLAATGALLLAAAPAGADLTPLDAPRSVSIVVDRTHNTASPEHFEDSATATPCSS